MNKETNNSSSILIMKDESEIYDETNDHSNEDNKVNYEDDKNNKVNYEDDKEILKELLNSNEDIISSSSTYSLKELNNDNRLDYLINYIRNIESNLNETIHKNNRIIEKNNIITLDYNNLVKELEQIKSLKSKFNDIIDEKLNALYKKNTFLNPEFFEGVNQKKINELLISNNELVTLFHSMENNIIEIQNKVNYCIEQTVKFNNLIKSDISNNKIIPLFVINEKTYFNDEKIYSNFISNEILTRGLNKTHFLPFYNSPIINDVYSNGIFVQLKMGLIFLNIENFYSVAKNEYEKLNKTNNNNEFLYTFHFMKKGRKYCEPILINKIQSYKKNNKIIWTPYLLTLISNNEKIRKLTNNEVVILPNKELNIE